MFKRMSRQDIIFEIIMYIFLCALIFIIFYPIYFVIIASFSDPYYTANGYVWFWVKGITYIGYEKVFSYNEVWLSYLNTVGYSGIGTLLTLMLSLPAAYALSRKDCPFRIHLSIYFIFTMFFSGGLVPTYLLIMKLRLVDTFTVMVLPFCINVFYLILARTFFTVTISNELLDAAKIDGCSNILFFTKIVLPLSKAIIAVLALYTLIDKWNSYYDALIYLRDSDRYPLQMVLRKLIVLNNTIDSAGGSLGDLERQKVGATLKYSLIVVSSFPVMIIYPFIQKHFTKGIMLGSIKG